MAEDTTSLATPAAVAAHLEALNLAGIGFATKRLLGKDPRPVAGQFTMWDRQDLPSLPSLTEGFWAALAPLRTGRPQQAAAASCDLVLQGRERDPDVAATAAENCGVAGKAQFRRAPLTLDPADQTTRDLLDAVKEFWRGLGTVYDQVRTRVIEGDHARAVRLLGRASTVLEPIVARVAANAVTVAGAGTAAASVEAPEQTDVEESHVRDADVQDSRVQATNVEQERTQAMPGHQVRGALGDRTQAEQRAEAFARSQPVRDEPVVRPRPVEVLSTKPVRNHVVAPIVFLLVVAGVALFVIFSVLNGPNPLAQ